MIKNRDTLIDIAKGVGILLVVFAHTYTGEVKSFIYMFHMPLFFILTGCALSYSSAGGIRYKRLARGIVIPYLVFSLITFAYWTLVESRFRPIHDSEVIPGLSCVLSFKAQQFVNIFVAMDTQDAFIYDIVLWFLPCLFVCRVLYGMISRIKYSAWILVFLAVAGMALPVYDIVLPWCVELAFVALPFICLGHTFYARCKEYLNRNTSLTCIIGGVLR